LLTIVLIGAEVVTHPMMHKTRPIPPGATALPQ
jgi:hypothetical protein